MTLRRPLPPGRTEESLRRQYEVECALADRLRAAGRDDRSRLYATMYDELFRAVPDHPRLTAAEEPDRLAAKNRDKLSLVEPWLRPGAVFVEFAPGDCSFATLVAGRVGKVYAIDISDQRPAGAPRAANLELVIYDGYRLATIPQGTADLVFSDQFLEHLHPEDVGEHLRLARALLRPGGLYALRTPHRFFGPHDISRYFADEPHGFHLKEWTHAEMAEALRAAGFGAIRGARRIRGRYRAIPLGPVVLAERLLGPLKGQLRQRLSRPFLARNLALLATR